MPIGTHYILFNIAKLQPKGNKQNLLDLFKLLFIIF